MNDIESAENGMALFVELTARACHEANRKYCQSIGDDSQVPWEEASESIKQSVYSGVLHIIENPQATPEDSHKNWLKDKAKAGWIYGTEKSEQYRTHPCIVPYDELPVEQKIKNEIFMMVVESMIETHLATEQLKGQGIEVDFNA